MKVIFINTILLFTLFTSAGQSQKLTLVNKLGSPLEQTSGLIFFDGKLITHTDSGGEAALYEIEATSGNILRTTTISNASNKDWEDICIDDNYIYIGDFGNNNGSRTDLKIYRLSISDYFSNKTGSVSVDTIEFAYTDQSNFSPGNFKTNFDAEAFISYGDSLYIFTKNWGNLKTNIYALPKVPGNYNAKRVDSINVQCMITDAVFDRENNQIYLCCYIPTTSFFISIRNFDTLPFSKADIEKKQLRTPWCYSYQIEGITPFKGNEFLLTAEQGLTGRAALYKLVLDVPVAE